MVHRKRKKGFAYVKKVVTPDFAIWIGDVNVFDILFLREVYNARGQGGAGHESSPGEKTKTVCV